jgi:hypothetical protein
VAGRVPATDAPRRIPDQPRADRLNHSLTAGSEAVESGTHPVQQAAKVAAEQAEETGGLGRLGRPIDRRSPLFIGMAGAAGVAITIALLELVIRACSVLVLIGLALFIAAGLDPVVSWLTRRRVPGQRPSSSCCLPWPE